GERPFSSAHAGIHSREESARSRHEQSERFGCDLANNNPRQKTGSESFRRSKSYGSGKEHEWVVGADGKARRIKPGIRLLAYGVPSRVAKLRALGNAIDPRPAATFIRAYMEVRGICANQQ